MDEKIAKKLIETAVNKNQSDDLLIYLVVVNRHTGKAEITQFKENPKNHEISVDKTYKDG